MYQIQSITPLMGQFLPSFPMFEQSCQAPITQAINDADTTINVGSGSIGGGNPSPVTVTEVTTPTYTALNSDYFLCVTHTGQVVITLPTGILGTVYIIKDCDGNASPATPIIVQGTAQNVDGGTATIDTPFGSISVIFNGTAWSIV